MIEFPSIFLIFQDYGPVFFNDKVVLNFSIIQPSIFRFESSSSSLTLDLTDQGVTKLRGITMDENGLYCAMFSGTETAHENIAIVKFDFSNSNSWSVFKAIHGQEVSWVDKIEYYNEDVQVFFEPNEIFYTSKNEVIKIPFSGAEQEGWCSSFSVGDNKIAYNLGYSLYEISIDTGQYKKLWEANSKYGKIQQIASVSGYWLATTTLGEEQKLIISKMASTDHTYFDLPASGHDQLWFLEDYGEVVFGYRRGSEKVVIYHEGSLDVLDVGVPMKRNYVLRGSSTHRIVLNLEGELFEIDF